MLIRARSPRSLLVVLALSAGLFAYLTSRIGFMAYADWCVADATEDSLNRAIALDPSNCDAYLRLGMAHAWVLDHADLKRSQELLQDAVRCRPLEGRYWLTLAKAQIASGQMKEAEAALSKSEALDSHNSFFLYQRGNAWLQAGETEKALDSFKHVLEGVRADQYAQQIFGVAWKGVADKELILRRAVPDETKINEAYLSFLSQPSSLDLRTFRNAWDEVSGLGDVFPRDATPAQLDWLMSNPVNVLGIWLVNIGPRQPEIGPVPWPGLPIHSTLAMQAAWKETWKQRMLKWNEAVAAARRVSLDEAGRVWGRLMDSKEPLIDPDSESALSETPRVTTRLMSEAGHPSSFQQSASVAEQPGLQELFDQVFPYMDGLLRTGRGPQAIQVWNQMVAKGILGNKEWRDPDNFIVNGGFETPPVNGGLDWRVESVGGVAVATDTEVKHDGDRALLLNFQGVGNVDYFHVEQLVPVEENTDYIFTAFMKSRALSTASGVHFEIYDPYEEGRNRAIEMKMGGDHWETPDVLGTTEWTEYSLPLHSGPHTRLLIVRLRRTPAVELDRRIAGTVWVDDVQLFRASGGQ
jgi:hypothetical protein